MGADLAARVTVLHKSSVLSIESTATDAKRQRAAAATTGAAQRARGATSGAQAPKRTLAERMQEEQRQRAARNAEEARRQGFKGTVERPADRKDQPYLAAPDRSRDQDLER